MRLLVLLMWSWAWLPQLLDLLVIGHQSPELGTVAQRSAPAEHAYTGIVLAMAVVAIALVFSALVDGHIVRVGAVLLLLLPWVALHGAYVVHGGGNNETILLPLLLAAFALNWRLKEAVLRQLRLLLITTAVASLAMGLTSPERFLSNPERVSGDKTLIGHLLLNGLFPTSNQLGIALALGIPVWVLTGQGKRRWLGLGVMLVALAWASSRTSLIATVLILSMLPLVLRGREAVAKTLVNTCATVCALLVVALPLSTSDPKAFSGRGAIWHASFDFLEHGPLLFGGGTLVFRDVSPVTLAIGAISSTGHNLFVSIVTVGGVVALASAAFLGFAYWRRALGAFAQDRFPMIFLLSVSAISVLEDPFRAFILSPSSFVLLPVLAVSFMTPLPEGHESNEPEQFGAPS